jgi:hypothetical protein
MMVPSSVLAFFAIGSFLLFAFALALFPPAQGLRDQRRQFFLGAAEHVFVTDQRVAEPAVVPLRFQQLVLEAFDDDLQLSDPKDRGLDDGLLGDRLVGLVIELLGVGLVQRPDFGGLWRSSNRDLETHGFCGGIDGVLPGFLGLFRGYQRGFACRNA